MSFIYSRQIYPWDYVTMTRDVRLFKVWRASFPHRKSIGFTRARHKLSEAHFANDYPWGLPTIICLLIVFSFNIYWDTASHNIRKRYWATWISRERWQEHYNLIRFENFSDFSDLLKYPRFPYQIIFHNKGHLNLATETLKSFGLGVFNCPWCNSQ